VEPVGIGDYRPFCFPVVRIVLKIYTDILSKYKVTREITGRRDSRAANTIFKKITDIVEICIAALQVHCYALVRHAAVCPS